MYPPLPNMVRMFQASWSKRHVGRHCYCELENITKIGSEAYYSINASI